MKNRRKFTARQRVQIVLEGLRRGRQRAVQVAAPLLERIPRAGDGPGALLRGRRQAAGEPELQLHRCGPEAARHVRRVLVRRAGPAGAGAPPPPGAHPPTVLVVPGSSGSGPRRPYAARRTGRVRSPRASAPARAMRITRSSPSQRALPRPAAAHTGGMRTCPGTPVAWRHPGTNTRAERVE
jgi:hypothetical protein